MSAHLRMHLGMGSGLLLGVFETRTLTPLCTVSPSPASNWKTPAPTANRNLNANVTLNINRTLNANHTPFADHRYAHRGISLAFYEEDTAGMLLVRRTPK